MSYKLRALLAFAVALVAVVVRLKPKAPAECDLELQLVAESARMVAVSTFITIFPGTNYGAYMNLLPS